MNTTKFYKDAIHEVVDALPESAVVGYRCVLPNSPIVYEKQGDGTWAQDADVGLGSRASLIGALGDGTGDVKYLKSNVISEVLTPFYGAGNANENVGACYWGDRLVIARSNKTEASDIIVVMPNGDTNKKELTGVITKVFADSLLNLWILSYNGSADYLLDKIPYSNGESVVTHYTADDGSLPFKHLSHMCVYGREIWAVNDCSDEFAVVHYDGYEWEDLTEQFKSDTTMTKNTLDASTVYDLYVDADGIVLISIYKSADLSHKLYSYNGIVFSGQNVASNITYIKKIMKVGNFVYTIKNNDYVIVWDYLTQEIYQTLGGTFTLLATDGIEAMAIKPAQIFAGAAGVDEDLTEETALNSEINTLTGAINLCWVEASVGVRIYLNLDAAMIIKGELVEGWVEV